MAGKTEGVGFKFSTMDWDGYLQFRPVYKEEVYSTVYAYHDEHKGAYGTAVDIGAGVGNVSAELTKKFSHVTVTDASESYLSSARSHFATFPPERIDFLQSKAEDFSLEKLPKGEQVDLVTAAECLHWADLEVAVPRIASILKPGGTFTAWLYGVRPILAEHSGNLAEAREIFYDIYDKMAHEYETQVEEPSETSGVAAINARLDHMPFSSDTWTDVRRIHTNTDAPMAYGGWPTTPSKVSASEKVESFTNENLLSHDADYEYLEGYLVNWIPALKPKEFVSAELAKLQKVMDGQKIEIRWPFVMILATKK